MIDTTTTLASLLTAAGAITAGTIVTLLVSVLKTGVKPIAEWDGMSMALALSGVLYFFAGLATIDGTAPFQTILNSGFVVFLSWLCCAAAAMGVRKAVISPVIDAVQANKPPSG